MCLICRELGHGQAGVLQRSEFEYEMIKFTLENASLGEGSRSSRAAVQILRWRGSESRFR